MFLTRKLGSILRGKATAPQILMATILGGMLGFVPGFILPGDLGGGFLQCPGLIATFFVLVAVLNANLAIFGFVTLLAKMVAFVTVPLAFRVGEFLLDGPLQGLFRTLINAPVTAWFGLEHYATTGGLVLGFGFGLVSGLVLVRTIRAFRKKMALLETGSPAFQKYTSKGSVRFLTWLLLGSGKGGKVTWQQLAERRGIGMPVRLTGLVFLALLVVTIWATQEFFSAKYLTATTRNGLETVNGATVDLKQAELDLASGAFTLAGLALADSKALDQDLFAAQQLRAKVSTAQLLRKRMVVDEIVSTQSTSGSKRAAPGKLIVTGTPPPPPEPPKAPGTKTLDDYIKEAQIWKQRLAQVEDWLDAIFGQGEGDPSAPPETKEQRQQRVEQEAQQIGPALVKAMHLIEGAPAVLVRKLALEGLTTTALPGETLDLRGEALSTTPRLVPDPARISLKSRSDKFALELALGKSFDFAYRGLAVDAVAPDLITVSGQPPLKGGLLDVAARGELRRMPAGWEIQLPLQVTLTNTLLTIQGIPETRIERLVLPIRIDGPLLAPRIHFDLNDLQKALLEAGKKEIADRLGAELGKALGGKAPAQAVDEAKKKLEEEAKKALKGLPNPFGGKK